MGRLLAISGLGLFILACVFSLWFLSQETLSYEMTPVIQREDVFGVAGYGRACTEAHPCEKPLACVYDRRVDTERCLASECWTDQQCRPGEVCRRITTLSAGVMVRVCTAEGIVKQGGRCWPLTHDPKESCQPGLICHGYTCELPCDSTSPSSCPAGYECDTHGGINACLKSCLKSGCPAGQRCYRIAGVYAECSEPTPRLSDCEKTPCPVGQECKAFISVGGYPQMECLTPCDEKRPCGEGQVCVSYFCHKRCQPARPYDCPPWTTCNYMPYHNAWYCGGH